MFYNFIIKNDDVKNVQVDICHNIHGESKLEIILRLKDYFTCNTKDPTQLIKSILLNNNKFVHIKDNTYTTQIYFSEIRKFLDIINADHIKAILEIYNEEVKIVENNLLKLKSQKESLNSLEELLIFE